MKTNGGWIILARIMPGQQFNAAKHCYEPCDVAEALVWLRPSKASADPDRFKQAVEYAAKENYIVITYPKTENDPLGRARFSILADAAARRYEVAQG